MRQLEPHREQVAIEESLLVFLSDVGKPASGAVPQGQPQRGAHTTLRPEGQEEKGAGTGTQGEKGHGPQLRLLSPTWQGGGWRNQCPQLPFPPGSSQNLPLVEGNEGRRQ